MVVAANLSGGRCRVAVPDWAAAAPGQPANKSGRSILHCGPSSSSGAVRQLLISHNVLDDAYI